MNNVVKEILIKIYYKKDNKQCIDTFVYDRFKLCYKQRDLYKNDKSIKYEGYKLYQKIEENIKNYEI